MVRESPDSREPVVQGVCPTRWGLRAAWRRAGLSYGHADSYKYYLGEAVVLRAFGRPVWCCGNTQCALSFTLLAQAGERTRNGQRQAISASALLRGADGRTLMDCAST